MKDPQGQRLSNEQKIRAAIAAEREGCVQRRREQAGIAGDSRGTWGLALSGGGIRSATFCLGLVRGLARNGVLKEFDYLSTVSGGGYLGASLGRLYRAGTSAAEVEEGVARDDSMWLWWLRNNGRYLTPTGIKDLGFAAASIVRGIVATHLEIGVLILLAAGIVLLPHLLVSIDPPRAFAFWRGMDPQVALARGWWSQEFAGLATSAWWWALLLPAFIGVHQMTGYWYTRDRWNLLALAGISLVALVAGGCALGLLGMARQLYVSSLGAPAPGDPQKIVITVAAGVLLLAPVTAWLTAVLDIMRGTATTALRLRHTKRLAAAMWLALAVVAIALLDTLAWWLTARFWETSDGGFPFGGAALVGVSLATARFVLPLIQKKMAAARAPLLNTEKLLNALGIALAIATAVFWTTLFSIAMFPEAAWMSRPQVAAWWQLPEVRVWGTVMLVSVAYVLLTCRSFELLNLASLHNFYRARIERAYVSSGNSSDEASRFPDGATGVATAAGMMRVAPLTEAIAGDDVELAAYRPHEHGGPIHLVNCCINQSVDDRTGIYNADRKGVALAVSALGAELGTGFPASEGFDEAPGKLSRWIAISGAAASTGMGSRTSPGFATLLFMSGIRLGYWTRALVRPLCELRQDHGWLRHRVSRWFPKPLAIVAESLARFPGQFGPVWYVSDGGHYDNTGIYALLKRRPRLIVAADCGADPKYLFGDLESLVRKAKIDYGASMDFLDPNQLGEKASPELRRVLGTPETITADAGSRWMVVGRIRYADGSEGTLVLVKPRRLDQMPFDIVAYADRNPEFPQQTTGDQFFDEAQWEAYHQLGLQMGGRLGRTLLRNTMTVVAEVDEGCSSLAAAQADEVQAPQGRRSRLGLTVGASVGAGLSLSLVLAAWQGIEQYRESRRADDARYLQQYQELKAAIADPGRLKLMDAREFDVVARMSRKRGDGRLDHLLRLINHECARLGEDAQAQPCIDLHSSIQVGPLPRHDYWFADRPRIPDHFDALSARLQRDRPDMAARLAVAPVRAAEAVPAPGGASGDEPPAGALPAPAPPAPWRAVEAAPVTPPVASPAPREEAQACAAVGFIQPRVNIHIYDEPSRALADALSAQLVRELHLEPPPVENVVRSSQRNRRAAPYVWSSPVVIVHAEVPPACAEAIQRRVPGGEVVLRPLPAGFKGNPGMIEIWLPPVR